MWVAAPLASLFLVLCLCAFMVGTPGSEGISIPTLQMRKHSPRYMCEDDRWMIVGLRGGGRVQINETPIAREHLAAEMKLIYANRMGRVTYLMAEPEASVADAAWAMDAIASTRMGIHVILMTPAFKDIANRGFLSQVESEPQAYLPDCDWEWSENGFDAPSIHDRNDQLYYLKYINPKAYAEAQK